MLKLLFTSTINKGHPLYLIPSCNQKQMHHVLLIPKSYEVTSEGHHKMTNQTLIDYINELLSPWWQPYNYYAATTREP